MIQNSKFKLYILVSIITLSVIEFILFFPLTNAYKSTYDPGVFIIILIFQIFLYFFFNKNTLTNKPFIIIIPMIIVIILPIFIYATLPSFTYTEGMEIVTEYINDGQATNFIQDDRFIDIVPASSGERTIMQKTFLTDNFYYYRVQINDKSKYFTVDPTTGQLTQLDKDYYGKKK